MAVDYCGWRVERETDERVRESEKVEVGEGVREAEKVEAGEGVREAKRVEAVTARE